MCVASVADHTAGVTVMDEALTGLGLPYSVNKQGIDRQYNVRIGTLDVVWSMQIFFHPASFFSSY